MPLLNISQDTLLSSLMKHNPWWVDQMTRFILQKKRIL